MLVGMGTSASHLLVMPPTCPVTVSSRGPPTESRWISIGAPGAVSRPMMWTIPPGWTVGDDVVSETGATHAQAMLAGTSTPNAPTSPTAKRRRDRIIAATPVSPAGWNLMQSTNPFTLYTWWL